VLDKSLVILSRPPSREQKEQGGDNPNREITPVVAASSTSLEARSPPGIKRGKTPEMALSRTNQIRPQRLQHLTNGTWDSLAPEGA